MNWEHLLELAEMLAGAPLHGETRGRPQQTNPRKANSTAYTAWCQGAYPLKWAFRTRRDSPEPESHDGHAEIPRRQPHPVSPSPY